MKLGLTVTLVLALWSAPANSQSTPASEWMQHAHDAQHTSFIPLEVPAPWRWKWAWNGPDESGAVSEGKFGLPRNVQPVTGNGQVYIAAGEKGFYALDLADGSQRWHQTEIGTVNSTAAYYPASDSLIVLSTGGVLFKLDAADGTMQAEYDLDASSTDPLPPAIDGDTIFVAMGNKVAALDIDTFEPVWTYTPGAVVQTPPAYSPSTNRVIVATEDLYVHAIDNASGELLWHVKPTVRQPDYAVSYLKGWPVIAEKHGLVFIKVSLDPDTVWMWSPWPVTNAEIRANLTAAPDQQALFALKLSDGTSPFVVNVGHGGYGDGGYLPMGPQPVVKTFEDGSQVVYTIGRGDTVHDGRWDSKFVEVLLDSETVPGYSGGEVRYIDYPGLVLTDEQPNPIMAGNYLLGGHWMAGYSLKITDRSNNLGAYDNRIRADVLPHITNSASNCGFSASHYCPDGLTQDDDPRGYPPGFYIYFNQGRVYDRYYTEYATWTVSNNTIFFTSADGAVVALESGTPMTALAVPASLKTNIRIESSPAETIPPSEYPYIHYLQAEEYAGEYAAVSGVIRQIRNNGKHVYLGFEDPHTGYFKAMIPKASWGEFSQMPDTLYQLGQEITVTGVITWYQGDPVIDVTTPAQIK